MKYIKIIIAFSILSCVAKAQQVAYYTQYMLNTIGMNPAYVGSNRGFEGMAGRRLQWYGFENAPTTTFISGSYGYRNNYSYKGMHGFGVYFEDDKAGTLSNKSAYLGYAYHLRINSGWSMSFGLFAGARTYGLSSGTGNPLDPAFQSTKGIIYMYPDVIPGYRLYSKKIFFDVSVRQLYKNTIKQGSQQIGTNTKLSPHYYLNLGRRFHTPLNQFIIVPSIKLQSNWLSLPMIDVTLMTYYKKRIGLGATYRINNAVSAILQVRALKNVVVGFAYDYTTTSFRFNAANSYEFVIGFSPVMSEEDKGSRTRVAACPDFDF